MVRKQSRGEFEMQCRTYFVLYLMLHLLAACKAAIQTSDEATIPESTADAVSAKQEPEMASDLLSQSRIEVAPPISTNATVSDSGKLKIEAGDITLRLAASGCNKQPDTLTLCNQGADLFITKTDSNFSQKLKLESVYIDSKEIIYRGVLNESNYHTFILSDVNGDDQEDLIVQTGNEGAYGGPSFSVYLFDLNSKQFKFNQLFSDLTVGTSSLFVVDHRKLKTWSKNGCCEHFYLTYEIRKNRPMLVEIITIKSTEKEVKTIIERLVNGEMRVVSE